MGAVIGTHCKAHPCRVGSWGAALPTHGGYDRMLGLAALDGLCRPVLWLRVASATRHHGPHGRNTVSCARWTARIASTDSWSDGEHRLP